MITTERPPAGPGVPPGIAPAARAVLDALPDVVLVIDGAATITFLNRAVERLLGHRLAVWLGRSVLDIVHPDDVAGVWSSIGSLEQKSAGTPIEVRIRDATGRWRWMEVVGTNGFGDLAVAGLVCVARDITERRRLEIDAGDAARSQVVMQVAPTLMLLVDRRGTITSVNGAVTRLLGHDPTHLVGRPLPGFVDAPSAASLLEALDRLRRPAQRAVLEVGMRSADRSAPVVPVRLELVDLTSDPLVGSIVVCGHDITDLHVAREELEHLARHDALTGAANRRLLTERMEQLLACGHDFSVHFIDLDGFKPVNDRLGHEAGDELLRLTARRLQHQVRPGDLVVRLGGDEFVVVAPGIVDPAATRALATRLEQALTMRFHLSSGEVALGASLGVATSCGHTTPHSVLAAADAEMYAVKSRRRARAG